VAVVARIFNEANLRKWAPVLVLLALCAAFTLINPNFLSIRNFGRIGIIAAPSLLIATGVTFIILMGSIDLSMEGTVAFCAVVFATVFVALGGTLASGWIAIPLAILTGTLVGLVNGLAHVKLKIPSFMASLSIGYVGLGATYILSGGYRITVQDPVFRSLLTVRFLELPLMVYAALAGLALAWFIQRHTVIGRNIYAVGGGEELARASGLNVERVRITGFAIAGFFYSLGALLAVARVGIADGDSGSNQMFTAITAVVVGGTSLIGGSGGVLNTLVGVLIVAAISNGMIVVGLPSYVQSGVLGAIVIIAVTLSTNRKQISFVK
jgi:ribose transport system permease protein